MAYVVVVHNGRELGRRELKGTTVIGRSTAADLCITTDQTISRKHCQIEWDEDVARWAVVDLNSRNGVYVYKERIARHLLKDGDEIRLAPGLKVLFYPLGFVPHRHDAPEDQRPLIDVDEELGKTEKPGAPIAAKAGRPLPKPIPRLIPQDAITGATPPPTTRRHLSQFPTPKPQPADTIVASELDPIPEDDDWRPSTHSIAP